jgi:hypothetical protein
MSGPLDISLKDELLFLKSLLIPCFNPDNELDTSKKRKEWLDRAIRYGQEFGGSGNEAQRSEGGEIVGGGGREREKAR